jgi:hypothetical protein
MPQVGRSTSMQQRISPALRSKRPRVGLCPCVRRSLCVLPIGSRRLPVVLRVAAHASRRCCRGASAKFSPIWPTATSSFTAVILLWRTTGRCFISTRESRGGRMRSGGGRQPAPTTISQMTSGLGVGPCHVVWETALRLMLAEAADVDLDEGPRLARIVESLPEHPDDADWAWPMTRCSRTTTWRSSLGQRSRNRRPGQRDQQGDGHRRLPSGGVVSLVHERRASRRASTIPTLNWCLVTRPRRAATVVASKTEVGSLARLLKPHNHCSSAARDIDQAGLPEKRDRAIDGAGSHAVRRRKIDDGWQV